MAVKVKYFKLGDALQKPTFAFAVLFTKLISTSLYILNIITEKTKQTKKD